MLEVGGIKGDLIPVDLLIEILSRLPVKSIARCRCVTKLWSSILARTDFTDIVLARSEAKPKLLLVCKKGDDALIFSSDQPQNPHDEICIVANYHHMIFPCDHDSGELYSPVHGLLYFKTMPIFEGRQCTVLVIRNPSTGQSLTLPRVKLKTNNKVDVMSFLGYDPTDKQFKLLCMTKSSFGGSYCGEYQVMTLGGTGERFWRIIECSESHYPVSNGVCINGVLYYIAMSTFGWNPRIACFDIRSEEFKFMDKAQLVPTAEMLNYKGKLATLTRDKWPSDFNGASISFKLCILQDAEKHEWTMHTYVLPPLWKDVVGNDGLYIVGVTRTGEIVFAPSPSYDLPEILYVIYYNLERNTIVKVRIEGIHASTHHQVYAFLEHVEDVKLGGVFRTP